MSRRDVRDTYDRIASHFASTRASPWPQIEEFLASRTGEVGLDIGVGNGRHASVLAEHCTRVIGLDLSLAALDEARRRMAAAGATIELCLGDAVSLPVVGGRVDLAVYVATLHHLPTREQRIRSLDELGRVLSPGGQAIVSAWCVSHERFDATAEFDTTVDWTLPDGEIVGRFYHIYDLAAFARDIDASDLVVESVFEADGNCFAVVQAEQ